MKTEIIKNAISLYLQKGLKFTLQDIANEMHIAKKTMYKYFSSKEELLVMMLDYAFNEIQMEKMKIINSDINYVEKLKKVLIALPVSYSTLQVSDSDELLKSYPMAYKCLNNHLNSDWEPVIHLIQEGIQDGVLRDISIPVFKSMITSTINQFVQSDVLNEANLSYQEGLIEMVDIMVKGVINEEN